MAFQGLTAIPQIYRNLARWREILGVLSRFGLAEGVSRLSPSLARDLFRSSAADAEVDALDHETRVRLALSELGPTAIKLGQVLSTRADVVGPRLARELEKLQTEAPPTDFEAIRPILESELERPLMESFAAFDPIPMASASIGQVHAATLPDGREVVVKVQHPEVERKVKVDLEILHGLAHLAERVPELRGYRPSATVVELQRILLREIDYGSEERHLAEFRRLFAKNDTVRIPEPVPSRSTRRVLTMERLDGIPLGDRAALEAAGRDLEEIARRGARIYLEMVFGHGVYHADPHPGNILILEGDVIGLLDFGMIGRLDEPLRDEIEEILLAVSAGDADYLTSILVRVGQVPMDLDHAAFGLEVAEFIAHYASQPIQDFDLGGALEDVVGLIRRYRITLPPRLSMLIKMLVVLEGSARILEPSFNLVEVIGPYQKHLLLRGFSFKRRFLKARRLVGEVEGLLEVLPRNLVDLMEQLQTGTFDVHLDHRGLEPSVNRLVWGLMTSALFLGSSLLLSFEVPPILAGYSLLGLIGVGISAVLGLRLLRAIGKSGHLEPGHRQGKNR